MPECVAIAKCQRLRLGTTGCAAPLTPGSSASVVQLRQNEAHLPSKKGVSRFIVIGPASSDAKAPDMSTVLPVPADTSVLGAHRRDGGASFGLWAPRATRVELALVDEDRNQTNYDLTCDDDGVWTVFIPGVTVEQRYGFRVHGRWDPAAGTRFNPAKLLVDPYARAITGGVDYSGPILDHTKESNYIPDTTDSFAAVPLSVVVAESPPPRPIARRRPMSETVIYELHVKGFTRLHPLVPEHLRGTYAGLAYPAVVQHLAELGVTAVELLPVHHYISEPFLVGRGLSNYWGYTPLATSRHILRTVQWALWASRCGSSKRWCRRCTMPDSRSSSMSSTTTPAKVATRVPRCASEASTTSVTTGSLTTSATTTTSPAAATRWIPPNPAYCAWCSIRCATGLPRWAWTVFASTLPRP